MEWVRIFSSEAEAQSRLKENQPQLVVVRKLRLCMVKRDNHFLVVQDACTHNGESLSRGKVNHLGEIICPWHGHQFDLASGREISERSGDLNTFPVRIQEDGVFIGI